MPHERFKSENYNNLGGINTKASVYNTGQFEFLDLVNLDFQTPGALSQRWGSTMYVSQTFGAPITSLFEFIKINGASYVMIGHTGGLWSGATTGNSQGLSLLAAPQGATQSLPGDIYMIMGTPGSTYYPNAINGGIKYKGSVENRFIGNDNNLYMFHSSPFGSNNSNFDFVTFLNHAFVANGGGFFKYDGSSLYSVGVPPVTASVSLSQFYGATGGNGISCVSGQYAIYASYINNRGVEGPVWPLGCLNTNGIAAASMASMYGSTFVKVVFDINTPLSYGISSINIYSFWAASSLVLGTAAFSYDFWNKSYTLLENVAASGSTQTSYTFGTAQGMTTTANAGAISTSQEYQNFNFGLGVSTSQRFYYSANFNNNYPSYLEVYQNRLFLAGFSSTPSTVWFSDVGEPEGYFEDYNFEVRTNDGDVIRAIKAYSTRLYILKFNSFHILYGDNPDNFYVQEVSLEYGCLNNRCAVVYDDILLFIDRKGVVKYSGSSIEILSNKVQEVFDSMNYSAAITEACMEHDKLRNQIVISLPINGSTTNNVMLVYDYLVGAWTKYDGPKLSALRSIHGRNNTKNLFAGSYSGVVSWFGPSFLADSGTGFTLYAKTRYLKPMGESTEEQYRKLYLNINAYSASTAIQLDFLKDYGSSVVLGRTMVINGFQNVMNFGISARSLAFEMKTIQTSSLFKFYGFTIESRFQRRD